VEELDALLLVGVVAGDDGEGRLVVVVDGLMRHVRRDEEEVPLLEDQEFLEVVPEADVDPSPHHVDRRLEPLVEVRFGGAVRRDDDEVHRDPGGGGGHPGDTDEVGEALP
jgi:hypothetical protein